MGRSSPFRAIVLLAAAAALAAAAQEPKIRFIPVPNAKKYPDATAPGALNYACAANAIDLERYFLQAGLAFEDALVKPQQGMKCQIFYQPTLAGFRALPDNEPLKGLYLDINLLGFLTKRTDRHGDSLDIAKEMLPQIRRPLEIALGLPQNQDPALYRPALDFHFPNSIHSFSYRDNTWDQTNPWAQDYLKSGTWHGQERILVTRLAFEGRAENGELFKPMLDSLKDAPFVRSKLSWEGGDLQFIRNPKDPSRLLLLYGDSATAYWGKTLSEPEFVYILRQEFGADDAANFTDISSHVDYFVCLLPRDNIALVSQPEKENYAIARAAVDALVEYFKPMPQPDINELNRLFSSRDAAFRHHLEQVQKLLDRISEKQADWPLPIDGGLGEKLEKYTGQNCPKDPGECVNPNGVAAMLKKDPKLLYGWAEGAISVRTGQDLTDRMVAVIRSQLPGFQWTVQGTVDKKVKLLEEFGFRVIRVPRLAGDPSLGTSWPGISYTNSALIDDTLFMPKFGFGPAEDAFFEKLRLQLPAHYKVVPLYARHMLLRNGGIHCISGLIRTRTSEPPALPSVLRDPGLSPQLSIPRQGN
jgi:hypothetical protein